MATAEFCGSAVAAHQHSIGRPILGIAGPSSVFAEYSENEAKLKQIGGIVKKIQC